MAAPVVESIAPSRIAEVAAFNKAAARLEEWKAKHPEAALELLEIAALYNPALKAADKVVRLRQVSSGPFDLYQFARKDKAEPLYTAVGRQKFASLGGVITPTETLTIDRERFDLAVAQEKVDPELAAQVVGYTPFFHKPEEIVLPGPAPDPGAVHLRGR